MANVAAGALVFAQFLGERAFRVAGRMRYQLWAFLSLARWLWSEGPMMIGIYVLFGGIACLQRIALLDGMHIVAARGAEALVAIHFDTNFLPRRFFVLLWSVSVSPRGWRHENTKVRNLD
jgi:hypothetical protein